MTTPRRFAALAVCLLALAAGASALDCAPSSITVELVDATDLATEPVVQCLSSATIKLSATCDVTIESAAFDNTYVKSIWANGGTYDQYKLCPATSSAAITAAGTTDAQVLAAVALAMDGYIYGFNGGKTAALITSGVTAAALPAKGKLQVTVKSKPLVYAIRDIEGTTATNWGTNATVTEGAGLTIKTQFLKDDDVNSATLGDSCAAGRVGLMLSSGIKLCALCPAGTYSTDGNGCMACSAGTALGAVGADGSTAGQTCANCVAGQYAQDGSSTCLPCPMHTFSTASGDTKFGGQCTPCPDNSYAWIPGSTGCVRCVNGIPEAVAPDATLLVAGTSGTHILKVAQMVADSCPVDELGGSYAIPAYGQCATWTTGTVTLQLALEVAGDCSINIKPIGDPTCSDPGANAGATPLFPFIAGQNGVTALSKYTYDYNALTMRAYYTTTTSIRSLLPSAADGQSSSFMLSIGVDGSDVKLGFYAATNKPAESTTVAVDSAACIKTVTVTGGSVVGKTAASCLAGSYGTGTTCEPCPQGAYCGGGTTYVNCTASEANPYLGQTDDTVCLDCQGSTKGYTSLEGAGYCTVPWFDRSCKYGDAVDGGYEWDESAGTCVKCRAGTYREANAEYLECKECDAGKYSKEGEATCTACPRGTYSPSKGLADQDPTDATGNHCLLCPVGSIAVLDGESAATYTIAAGPQQLNPGATECAACPSGTYADPKVTTPLSKTQSTPAEPAGCSLCDAGLYRAGDASPTNNLCARIPAGYKAKSFFVNKLGAFELAVCELGAVSYWSGSIRYPEDLPDQCLACTANTYAPRTGMSACLSCKGGSQTKKVNAPNGNDVCEACGTGTFRSYYTLTSGCAACAEGKEAGPSGRQACTLCRPGNYKTSVDATKDYCSECPINKYQSTPGATSDCSWCPKGTETQDTGNSECTPCAVGYYNPKTPTSGTTPACKKAPAGTFVNTTGAFFATACPVGYYNNVEGQEECEPCAPGQYAQFTGSKSCKTCPAGTYSGGAASTCRTCVAGYYAPAGSGACVPCKPGTYTNAARSGVCLLCPKGKQCPSPGTTTPRDCPAGTFSSKDGSTLCTPCPVNTYAANAGSKQCTRCAAGTNTRGLAGQKVCQAVRVTTLRRSVL